MKLVLLFLVIVSALASTESACSFSKSLKPTDSNLIAEGIEGIFEEPEDDEDGPLIHFDLTGGCSITATDILAMDNIDNTVVGGKLVPNTITLQGDSSAGWSAGRNFDGAFGSIHYDCASLCLFDTNNALFTGCDCLAFYPYEIEKHVAQEYCTQEGVNVPQPITDATTFSVNIWNNADKEVLLKTFTVAQQDNLKFWIAEKEGQGQSLYVCEVNNAAYRLAPGETEYCYSINPATSSWSSEKFHEFVNILNPGIQVTVNPPDPACFQKDQDLFFSITVKGTGDAGSKVKPSISTVAGFIAAFDDAEVKDHTVADPAHSAANPSTDAAAFDPDGWLHYGETWTFWFKWTWTGKKYETTSILSYDICFAPLTRLTGGTNCDFYYAEDDDLANNDCKTVTFDNCGCSIKLKKEGCNDYIEVGKPLTYLYKVWVEKAGTDDYRCDIRTVVLEDDKCTFDKAVPNYEQVQLVGTPAVYVKTQGIPRFSDPDFTYSQDILPSEETPPVDVVATDGSLLLSLVDTWYYTCTYTPDTPTSQIDLKNIAKVHGYDNRNDELLEDSKEYDYYDLKLTKALYLYNSVSGAYGDDGAHDLFDYHGNNWTFSLSWRMQTPFTTMMESWKYDTTTAEETIFNCPNSAPDHIHAAEPTNIDPDSIILWVRKEDGFEVTEINLDGQIYDLSVPTTVSWDTSVSPFVWDRTFTNYLHYDLRIEACELNHGCVGTDANGLPYETNFYYTVQNKGGIGRWIYLRDSWCTYDIPDTAGYTALSNAFDPPIPNDGTYGEWITAADGSTIRGGYWLPAGHTELFHCKKAIPISYFEPTAWEVNADGKQCVNTFDFRAVVVESQIAHHISTAAEWEAFGAPTNILHGGDSYYPDNSVPATYSWEFCQCGTSGGGGGGGTTDPEEMEGCSHGYYKPLVCPNIIFNNKEVSNTLLKDVFTVGFSWKGDDGLLQALQDKALPLESKGEFKNHYKFEGQYKPWEFAAPYQHDPKTFGELTFRDALHMTGEPFFFQMAAMFYSEVHFGDTFVFFTSTTDYINLINTMLTTYDDLQTSLLGYQASLSWDRRYPAFARAIYYVGDSLKDPTTGEPITHDCPADTCSDHN